MPKSSRTTTLASALAILAISISAPARASCGSAYCSLNTDLAAEAAGIVEGSTFDLRYESIKQAQPRSGSDKVGVGELPRHHDEISTRNRNLVATYGHSLAAGWGFSVAAPLVDREHLHLHNHHGAKLQEEWNFRELGDLRVTGRYQSAPSGGADDATGTAGLVAGLKLPTGRTGVTNAAGEVAERSLQPGTGTTDVILGAYFHQLVSQHAASWFTQAQMQRTVSEHGGYRPGTLLTLDVGYAKAFADKLSGIVQLNAVVKSRDRGANAEPEDSGGRFLYLSPGLSYQLTDSVRAYAFYQQPLHQSVNGVQLTADRAFVAGISTRF